MTRHRTVSLYSCDDLHEASTGVWNPYRVPLRLVMRGVAVTAIFNEFFCAFRPPDPRHQHISSVLTRRFHVAGKCDILRSWQMKQKGRFHCAAMWSSCCCATRDGWRCITRRHGSEHRAGRCSIRHCRWTRIFPSCRGRFSFTFWRTSSCWACSSFDGMPHFSIWPSHRLSR